mmetsp:Transcript_20482/g.24408  ORF Transcript_20482/g.24408 Transcript_20482/m.24408 type:complete len:266 (-) Transcript_20482:3-800(-)
MSTRKTRSSTSAGSKLKFERSTTNPYMEQVRLKREKNKQRLKDLGLISLTERRRQLRNKRRAQQQEDGFATPSTPASSTPTPPTRKSARQMRKPVQYTAIDAIEDADRLLALTIARRKRISTSMTDKKAVKRRKVLEFDSCPPIGDAMMQQLTRISSDEWVEDMQRYFAEHQGNSVNNVQRVMLVVRRLAAGVGVQHPATREGFKKNEKIHLGCNFRAMLDDASEWVYSNGGDRGNGWLIEHPVKKCLIYQMARVEHGTAFFFGK